MIMTDMGDPITVLMRGTSFASSVRAQEGNIFCYERTIPQSTRNDLMTVDNITSELDSLFQLSQEKYTQKKDSSEKGAEGMIRKNDQSLRQNAFIVTDDIANSLRKKHRIHVHKAEKFQKICPPIVSFEQLEEIKFCTQINSFVEKSNCSCGTLKKNREISNCLVHNDRYISEAENMTFVPSWLVRNIRQRMGFISPTSIQMQAIPAILSGCDVVASAPTGTGKSAAFLIPIISLLKKPQDSFARAVVICPSRELAKQTQRTFELLTSGKGFRAQYLDENFDHNTKRIDLALCTPLRTLKLLQEEKIVFSSCEHVVLDEADKLLDSGFASQLDGIFFFLKNTKKRVYLFSATYTPAVTKLARSFIPDAIRISVGVPNAACSNISQRLIFTMSEEGKVYAVRNLWKEGLLVPPCLIFCETRDRARHIFKALLVEGLSVTIMHSDLSKKKRDLAVEKFRTGKIWFLICSDLMSRGIDFKGVEMVINYDFPNSSQNYIHRAGRAGRANRKGSVITLFTLDDIPKLQVVIGVMRQSGCEIPDWLNRTFRNKKDFHALRKKIEQSRSKKKFSGRKTRDSCKVQDFYLEGCKGKAETLKAE